VNVADAIREKRPLTSQPFRLPVTRGEPTENPPKVILVRNPSEGGDEGPHPRIVYGWSADVRAVNAGPRICLDEFIRLADAGDFAERVRGFVARWGPLELDNDGLPGGHPMRATDPFDPESSDPAGPFWEPVPQWLPVVQHVDATLHIARCLQEGRAGEPQHWEAIRQLVHEVTLMRVGTRPLKFELVDVLTQPVFSGPTRPGDLADERRALAEILAWWWERGAVDIEWSWEDSATRPTAFIQSRSIASTLAIQLGAYVTSTKGLHLCAGCGHSFTPPEKTRKPRRGGYLAWCADCGRHAQYLRANRLRRGRTGRKEAKSG
jgi:hypothetical protein